MIDIFEVITVTGEINEATDTDILMQNQETSSESTIYQEEETVFFKNQLLLGINQFVEFD